ncbi:MAG: hypothetical protein ACM34A_14400 [Bacillota bacterium]
MFFIDGNLEKDDGTGVWCATAKTILCGQIAVRQLNLTAMLHDCACDIRTAIGRGRESSLLPARTKKPAKASRFCGPSIGKKRRGAS